MSEPELSTEKIFGMSAGQFVNAFERYVRIQENRLAEEFDKLFFGEREGGPVRFESTPREGPNPFYERYFKPVPQEDT